MKGSQAQSCILRRLEKRNPTLKTGGWRVLSREEKLRPKGYNLILQIPTVYMRVFKETYFKSYLEFARVYVSVTQKKIRLNAKDAVLGGNLRYFDFFN